MPFGVEAGELVVESVETATDPHAVLRFETDGEHAGLLGVLPGGVVGVVAVDLVDEPGHLLAAVVVAAEVDLDAVGTGEHELAAGVDADGDAPAVQDLAELAERGPGTR